MTLRRAFRSGLQPSDSLLGKSYCVTLAEHVSSRAVALGLPISQAYHVTLAEHLLIRALAPGLPIGEILLRDSG